MAGKILIVDYGMGNLHSVVRKFERLNVKVTVSRDPEEIAGFDKLVLVGVGHFKKAMDNLRNLNLIEPLNKAVIIQKKPILGICLGMHLMGNKSEEGNAKGLGWVDADVKKIEVDNTLKFKVPHMGWNQINITKESLLMRGVRDNDEFYFAHSYFMKVKNESLILNETKYESEFTSAIEQDNIFGVQYHPEKSHKTGETLLSNFIKL
ncbi:imidazole glycerol phosphate synthase subunit HisH [bacterium]|jgi:imidazole glycerol-phosphate synthase subunit HisH|nr:imidazole glycerol phosphate synthase subunit HisH [bacterium]